ncbi:hybrid sensor histidine kinase/response regulator [Sediminitomix flava]|uniref:histidine kinase n=1 Tax=Sediminitomix flava TaxID=379075 RepID=A0A315Z6Q3_SEDFL|nr:hybrid sensor histidine kinase/response regulator [Sediminitomix flava]PWJ38435.1 signal transduction histidine kinase [Sediminitomix flava]
MEINTTNNEKSTVLYVDDEPQNLVSFRASFRKIYHVLTAQSGPEALEILEEKHQEISVIVSDQLMPKMTGVELLEKARELYPDIMRIVLTGYSDVQDIINSISRGEVYRYITKPWNRDELQVTLDNAIEAFNLKVENKRLFADLKKAYGQLEEEAKLLDQKVKERTKELEEQKEEVERKRIILPKQNEELNALDGEKNYLIGVVAHDLKSPLNQISGFLELISLSDENLTDEQQEYIKMISQSIDRQSDMITQILDLKAIESNSSNKNTQKLDLALLLRETAERYFLTAQKKNIVIETDIPDEKMEAMLDENYTHQIYQNLISNAIKFSPKNKKLFIRLNNVDGVLKTEVKDEGPGLSEEDKAKLFGRFQKLSARPTDGEHSTGLGLSIVKRLVEDMDGKVYCESKEGEGANFIVEFPKV